VALGLDDGPGHGDNRAGHRVDATVPHILEIIRHAYEPVGVDAPQVALDEGGCDGVGDVGRGAGRLEDPGDEPV
jgi:hypothetical protein